MFSDKLHDIKVKKIWFWPIQFCFIKNINVQKCDWPNWCTKILYVFFFFFIIMWLLYPKYINFIFAVYNSSLTVKFQKYNKIHFIRFLKINLMLIIISHMDYTQEDIKIRYLCIYTNIYINIFCILLFIY